MTNYIKPALIVLAFAGLTGVTLQRNSTRSDRATVSLKPQSMFHHNKVLTIAPLDDSTKLTFEIVENADSIKACAYDMIVRAQDESFFLRDPKSLMGNSANYRVANIESRRALSSATYFGYEYYGTNVAYLKHLQP